MRYDFIQAENEWWIYDTEQKGPIAKCAKRSNAVSIVNALNGIDSGEYVKKLVRMEVDFRKETSKCPHDIPHYYVCADCDSQHETTRISAFTPSAPRMQSPTITQASLMIVCDAPECPNYGGDISGCADRVMRPEKRNPLQQAFDILLPKKKR